MKGYTPLIFYMYQNYLVSVDNSRELIQSKDWLPSPGVTAPRNGLYGEAPSIVN